MLFPVSVLQQSYKPLYVKCEVMVAAATHAVDRE